jgi:hypothetical protein
MKYKLTRFGSVFIEIPGGGMSFDPIVDSNESRDFIKWKAKGNTPDPADPPPPDPNAGKVKVKCTECGQDKWVKENEKNIW